MTRILEKIATRQMPMTTTVEIACAKVCCMTPLDELPRISAPAQRALANAGITSLRDLAGRSRSEIAALHGTGPKALGILTAALAEHGLRFSPAS